jgi:serine/threonine protein kinase
VHWVGGDLSGQLLGRYRLESRIGSGAFGTVYRARHADLDLPRALKVLRAEVAGDPDLRRRFLQEARTAAALDHPNVVRVHDYAGDGIPYIVMDLVDSATLAERLAGLPPGRRLTDPSVRRWVRDIGSALDHAHAHGVVHRDVKPENVLVRRADGRALVTDFGIARAQPDPELTRTGRSLGTYAYMSPEQCRGEGASIGPRSDVYSFAALLFELVTGQPPYGRGMAAVAGHLDVDAPVPSARRAGASVPVELDAALGQGLTRDPERRQRSAGELADAFLRAAGPSGGRPASRRPRRRLVVAAGAAGAAVLLAGGGAAAAMRSQAAVAARQPLAASGRPSSSSSRPSPAASSPSPVVTVASRRTWPRFGYDLQTHSETVKAIQLLLLTRRVDVGRYGADGVYGSDTERVVQEFQRTSGLPVTGVIDAATWERLVVPVGSGSRRPEVEAAQRLLRARDGKLTVDGQYGRPTETAVRSLQAASHRPATGRIDADTWCLLVGGRVPPAAQPASPARTPAPQGQATAPR